MSPKPENEFNRSNFSKVKVRRPSPVVQKVPKPDNSFVSDVKVKKRRRPHAKNKLNKDGQAT
jgi:hypothetical protein